MIMFKMVLQSTVFDFLGKTGPGIYFDRSQLLCTTRSTSSSCKQSSDAPLYFGTQEWCESIASVFYRGYRDWVSDHISFFESERKTHFTLDVDSTAYFETGESVKVLQVLNNYWGN